MKAALGISVFYFSMTIISNVVDLVRQDFSSTPFQKGFLILVTVVLLVFGALALASEEKS